MKNNKKLIHNNKIILNNLRYLTTNFELFKGLMFSSKENVKEGICLVLPNEDIINIHMIFCFYKYDILFIDSNFKVMNKDTLNPFTLNNSSKKPVKYIIESCEDKFKDIKIGDYVQII